MIKIIKCKEGYLEYEIEKPFLFILNVEVLPIYRRKGLATKMLNNLFKIAKLKKLPISTGVFTEKGKVLIHLIEHLAETHKVKVVYN
jgi:GNAT superfamily N-acetyltransferase